MLYVVSDGDTLLCHPKDGQAFSQDVPKREVLWLKGKRAPDHMGLLTSAKPESTEFWLQIADWMLKTAQPEGDAKR